jgi:hypothetical protein
MQERRPAPLVPRVSPAGPSGATPKPPAGTGDADTDHLSLLAGVVGALLIAPFLPGSLDVGGIPVFSPVTAAMALWVAYDAQRIGVRKGVVTGIADLGIGAWAAGCILLYIVAAPLYFWHRQTFRAANGRDSVPQQNGVCRAIAVGIPIIWLVITVGWLGRLPGQSAVLSYINDTMVAHAKDEQGALSRWREVAGANFKDDQTMQTALVKDIIPAFERCLARLERAKSTSPQVTDLNRRLAEQVRLKIDGYKQIAAGCEKHLAEEVKSGSQKLLEADKQIVAWNADLTRLMKTYDVYFKK